MKTIYKYELRDQVVLPASAQILYYGTDPRGIACLWAIVDTEDMKTKTKEYAIIGTGWPVDILYNTPGAGYSYITTVNEGPYMWHIFEKHTYDCDIKLNEEMLMDMIDWELK